MNKNNQSKEDNPRCSCGHLINKSHIIDQKKTMKTSRVHGKCKFCSCRSICIA